MSDVPPTIPNTVSPFIIHFFLAIFGALVHASKAYRDGKSKTWIDHFLLAIMASFSGVMVGLIGIYWFGVDSYLALTMTGIGSYAGTESLTFVMKYVFDKFKTK